MGNIYKIHPSIGFGRVGRSPDGFFLAPAILDGQPLELSDQGVEVAFRGYKDDKFLMRRQAARFRIYEYDQDEATKRLTLVREITAANAKITWKVVLASRKAAGPLMQTDQVDDEGARIVTPGTDFRNEAPPGFTRDDLVASLELTASGVNQKPTPGAEPMAKFLKKDFYIGEVRTDLAGHLIVLGGRGDSACWLDPPSMPTDFLNNAGWHDDIADGSVDATFQFADRQPMEVTGAWVIVGPPDFAPSIAPITTLYDIALQAAAAPIPVPVSFPQDIAPILKRAANLYWVNNKPVWATMRGYLTKFALLGDKGAANAPIRQAAYNDLLKAHAQMADYRLTARQMEMLTRWKDGDFIPNPDPTRPALDAGSVLDQASLACCIGGGFFPGIEAGLLMREPTIYSEFARLTRGTFTDYGGVSRQLVPGLITERMACPWQADFTQCEGNWWPAQRPDLARYDAQGHSTVLSWDRGVVVADNHEDPNSMQNMVDRFARLGVIGPVEVAGQQVFAETGRDPGL